MEDSGKRFRECVDGGAMSARRCLLALKKHTNVRYSTTLQPARQTVLHATLVMRQADAYSDALDGHYPFFSFMTERIYVGGLPPDITIADLEGRFTPFGRVSGCEFHTKGIAGADAAPVVVFAYVDLESKDDASLRKCITVVRTEGMFKFTV